MPRTLTFDKGFRLFLKALASKGTRLGVTRAEWDLSGNCLDHKTVEYVGRRERFMMKHHVVQPRWNEPHTWESVSVVIHTKCRHCDTCLKKKRQHWWFRMKAEFSVAPRTWFGTLTYAPEEIVKRRILAERRAVRRGYDWVNLDDDAKHKALVEVCGVDLTLFLKRVRKATGVRSLRYILVSERHDSGLPHWHLLVHEHTLNAVTHRILSGAWKAGFSKFKLADPKAASYVGKYISKDFAARVRASQNYGDIAAFALVPENRRARASGAASFGGVEN